MDDRLGLVDANVPYKSVLICGDCLVMPEQVLRYCHRLVGVIGDLRVKTRVNKEV